MARRHIIVTTSPCWTTAPICCSLESDEPATGRAETWPEEVKRHWRGGDFGCGLYTADISIWQGSLWLLCKPQPRKSTRRRRTSIPFPTPPTPSIAPSCFYCKLPSDYLSVQRDRPSTSSLSPSIDVCAGCPSLIFLFFFPFSSILMPVIKNSGRLSFVCFSFSLQIPNQFFSYSSLSSTSSYCRLFRLLLLLLPIVVGDVRNVIFSGSLQKTAISLTTTVTVFFRYR